MKENVKNPKLTGFEQDLKQPNQVQVYQQELDLLNKKHELELSQFDANIKVEDELAKYSDYFEAMQIIEKAKRKGVEYGVGFREGFEEGYAFLARSENTKKESFSRQFVALMDRQKQEMAELDRKYTVRIS